MKRVTAVLVLLSLVAWPVLALAQSAGPHAGPGGRAGKDDWSTYTSSLGHFTVEVPGTASEETMRAPDGKTESHVVRCPRGGDGFVVMFMTKHPATRDLDTFCDGQVRVMESKGQQIVGRRPATISGVPAREFLVRGAKESGRVLIFFQNDRIYWMWVLGSNPNEHDINRFFTSFQMQ